MPAAKKTTPKKTTRKVASPKSTTKKQSKTVAIKRAVKKPTTKKAAPRKVGKTKKQPKKTLTGVQTKPSAKDTSEAVVVPQNVPLRSIEKAEVLRSELSVYVQKSMYRIALTSGLCFLLVGSTYASVSVFDGSAYTYNTALVADSLSEPVSPVLTLHSTVPPVLTAPTKVFFTLTGVYPESVQYYIINRDTAAASARRLVEINPENKYSFSLSPVQIPPGQYDVFIRYSTRNSTSIENTLIQTKRIARFSIGEPVEVVNEREVQEQISDVPAEGGAETNIATETTNDGTATEEPTVQTLQRPSDQEELLNTEGKSDAQSTDASAADVSTSSVQLASSSPIRRVVEGADETVSDVALGETSTSKQFTLFLSENDISGVVIVNTALAQDLRDLELFARPVTSLNSRFLGRATERSGSKMFVVNTAAFLPNGTYELYARGVNPQNRQVTTPSVVVTVKNQPREVDTPLAGVELSADQETVVVNLGSSSAPAQRAFASSTTSREEADTPALRTIRNASERLLQSDTEKITQLLNNYASARQSGDEILIQTAREALAKRKVELANTALVDRELSGISDDVIEDMSERLADLQNRVDTFEQIRKQRSEGRTAVDTDGDGIPDYDEINLYRTNPNAPDTDGDGFTDGIEIMRGFDPLNAMAEAVIEFESPKESVGLVRQDELVVEEVIPSINTLSDTDGVTVATEIRGRGLPNSFVTLYIFSTPTIVTIQTDADGSFVYTLDRELSDGSHDVFVALTDNTGAIVAQSNPFSFVKEAQAFTPVDAAGGTVVEAETIVQSAAQTSYNAVLGLGVLAFGLILLMLGFSLRTNEDENIQTFGKKTTDGLGSVGTQSKNNAT